MLFRSAGKSPAAATGGTSVAPRKAGTPARPGGTSGGTTGSNSGGGGSSTPAPTGNTGGTPAGDINGPYGSCEGFVASGCDHRPRVTANGQYTPGCDGYYSYTQSTGSGGGIIINVPYAYMYTTFSTADGWGLKVFSCI